MPAHNADTSDTTTMPEKLLTATDPLQAVLPATRALPEVVGNKHYRSYATLVALAALELAQLRIGTRPPVSPLAGSFSGHFS